MSKILPLAFLLAQIALIASEKVGVCPSVASPLGACVITCGDDKDCQGTTKCCNNGCGAWCSEATCPPAQTRIDCPSSLCTYVGCPGKDRKSLRCSVDFCNQCKVNFFNISTGDVLDCGPVETMCSRMRAASNNKHLLGQYIPDCDKNGAFKRVQCHGGNCFCVDKRGVPDMSTKVIRGGTPKCPEKTLCQQQIEQAKKLPPIGRFVPQCKPDGSFKEQQCHASTGQCWCVDTYGREWFGTRSRGKAPDCTKSVCSAGVTQLKCDPMICRAASCPGFKNVVCRVNPCGKCQPEFLDKYNRPVKCLTPCQSQRNEALGVDKPAAKPLVGRYVPQCTDNGQFQQIQCYGSTGYCWCVDRSGSPVLGSIVRGRPHCNSSAVGVCPPGKPMFTCLRDFCQWKTCPAYPNATCQVNPCGFCKAEFVDASGNVIKDSDCVKGTTLCQQKRAQAVQTGHGGLQPVGRFVPGCDVAGNFKSMQCWGSVGYCWCVNATTGIEVHGSRVRGRPDCSKQPAKPVNDAYCPLKQLRTRQSRSASSCHLASKCSVDSHCQGGSKCCNSSSCGTICQKPIVTACPNGRPFMLCLHMCNFVKCPAYPKAQCFSDPCSMCKIEFRDTIGNKLDCSKGLTPCQLRRQQAMGLLGAFRPECDSQGNYKFIQQHEGYSWCVDSNGKEINGTKMRFSKPSCPNNGSSSLTLCQLQNQKVTDGRTLLGRYVPQCESDGSFKQVQCHPSTGYCWCVNKTTGVIVRDTQIRGQPDCNRVCSPVMCRMYCEYGFVKDQFGCGICRCAAVPVKPGFCPVVKSKSPSESCQDTCKQDNDCPGSNKCCSNGCSRSCTSAVLKAKPGVCPRRPVDHVGMCMNKCGDDADCHGDQKCCSNGCGRECSAPIRKACPYGQPLVMCHINPCSKMASCPAHPKAVCRPSYCGSCKAEFFDQDYKIVDCSKGLTTCQSQYLKATSKGPLVGLYIPQCDKNGAFNAMQCSGSTGHCWCVDTEAGKKIPNTDRGRTEDRPSCNVTKVGPVCLKNKKRFTLCQGSLCESTNCTRNPRARCVVPMGTCDRQCQAKFYDYDGSEVQCLTECQQKALEATQKGLVGAYKPTCNSDGTYTLIQCHPSTGKCWCSSPDGKEWPGTRARGKPTCLRLKSGLDITKVHVKLTFKNDFETINNSLADFITVLKTLLSQKLGIKEEQITELSVTKGSIIAEFYVVPVDGGRDVQDFVEHVQHEVRQGFVITYAGMKFVASPQFLQAAANYKSDEAATEKGGLTNTHIALICVFVALAIIIVAVIAVVVKKKRSRAREDTDTAGFIYKDGRAESYSAVSTS